MLNQDQAKIHFYALVSNPKPKGTIYVNNFQTSYVNNCLNGVPCMFVFQNIAINVEEGKNNSKIIFDYK